MKEVVFVIIILGTVLLIGGLITETVCDPMLDKINKMGYDSTEVRIFVRRIGADLQDFINSKGIRKQYELFRDGKSSDFIQKAEQEKSKADAQAVGMATGMAIGTSIRR